MPANYTPQRLSQLAQPQQQHLMLPNMASIPVAGHYQPAASIPSIAVPNQQPTVPPPMYPPPPAGTYPQPPAGTYPQPPAGMYPPPPVATVDGIALIPITAPQVTAITPVTQMAPNGMPVNGVGSPMLQAGQGMMLQAAHSPQLANGQQAMLLQNGMHNGNGQFNHNVPLMQQQMAHQQALQQQPHQQHPTRGQHLRQDVLKLTIIIVWSIRVCHRGLVTEPLKWILMLAPK